MPGVSYERQVQFTLHGPVAINVLRMPRPGGLWNLEPVLSNDVILGTERLTAIERRLSPAVTSAGIGADYFASDGRPIGIVMRGGALDHQPIRERSSIGLFSDGSLRVERVQLIATWQGSGQRRAVTELNEPPEGNGVALFTPAWGPSTPAVPGASVAVVLEPFGAVLPNQENRGTAARVVQSAPAAIPPDGAVLLARGTAATKLAAEAPEGQQVTIRPVLKPDWAGAVSAVGGGPALVRNGKAIFRANEAFTLDQLLLRQPRAAIGQRADGQILFVTVDGDRPGYSTGMTNFELAQAMLRLRAVTASALGPAGAAMAFEGELLSRPPAGEKPLGDALLVTYAGVTAPAPLEAVLSPNGDGIGERQLLSYKIVRPSTVDVSLLGPDGAARYSSSGSVAPGTYSLEWTGLRSDGTPDLEGRYRWIVNAADDLGRASTVERRFTLNRTLGFPKTVGGALTVPRPTARSVASFTLTRAATVTARIETAWGSVLRTLWRQKLDPGEISVAWDGVTDSGAVVFTGRYVARLIAENEIGSVDLTSPFAVRRTRTAG